MPWKIYKEDDEYCVHKVADGEKGELESCHDTKAKADDHLEALYANEEKMYSPPPLDVETFDELDEHRELSEKMEAFHKTSRDFLDLAENVVFSYSDYTVEEKGRKVVKLSTEYAERIKNNFTKEEGGFIDKFVKRVSELIQPAPQNLVLYKDNGRLRWIARYSNNIRDIEKEIIASQSHKRFVELVDKGVAPYPGLLVWHEKEWKIGETDWLAYDDSGYALASGTVNKEAEGIATWISKQKDIRMSHGMPTETIKRDEDDPLIIVEHETAEISILPKSVAANKLTGWYVIGNKEQKDMIPEEKKSILSEWGLDEEALSGLEELNKAEAEVAADVGLDSKEIDEEEVEEQEEKESQETEQKGVPREEVAEALTAIVETMNKSFARLNERIDQIDEEVEKKVADKIASTPTASLAGLMSKNLSVTDKKETEVDGRETLAKSGPEEAEEVAGETGIPFIDQMLAGGK